MKRALDMLELLEVFEVGISYNVPVAHSIRSAVFADFQFFIGK